MEVCLRPLVSLSFYKTTIIRQITKWNESKIEKYSQKSLGLCRNLYVCLWVCVRVCVWVFVWDIIAYYYVCTCEWYIVHVYVMVHAQHIVFPDVKCQYIYTYIYPLQSYIDPYILINLSNKTYNLSQLIHIYLSIYLSDSVCLFIYLYRRPRAVVEIPTGSE